MLCPSPANRARPATVAKRVRMIDWLTLYLPTQNKSRRLVNGPCPPCVWYSYLHQRESRELNLACLIGTFDRIAS